MNGERTSDFNNYKSQKERYKLFVEEAINKPLQTTDSSKSPKDLTYYYDDEIHKKIQEESRKDEINAGKSATSTDPYFYTENIFEELFIRLTHFRRETKGGGAEKVKKARIAFIAMYDAIKETDEKLLENKLLLPFKLHYWVFKDFSDFRGKKGIFLHKNKDNLDEFYCIGMSGDSSDAAIKCTYASCVFSVLKKEYKYLDEEEVKDYYERVLKAIDGAIKSDDEYALYYSVKAQILLWGAQNGYGEKHELKEFRDLLNTAIDKEHTSETGLRKRTEYIKLLSDVNVYEMDLNMEESEMKMQEIEANSIKKMGAFSAFVSFAVGLLSKMLSSTTMVFRDTVGLMLMLLGISFAIYTFFDALILGPYALNKLKKDENGKRKISRGFIFKTVIEVGLVIVFIVGGIGVRYWLGADPSPENTQEIANIIQNLYF
ncbi:MAG: hypothetical protein J6126_05440 [Clostridia bacterium]|nr:hypothetical protein [Clostridia bacterium]